ncbi:NAD(P)-dependent alcohol dehydrogenase [Chondrinema litorale]|uniref:NAD(P)-dependent alcohol dehydrogenase n=1 Tax=Chondrinema litorale TaxID=2994555 RepID=UPI002543D5FE|nr:NAD(P)-dependent alcohol dehydrogenase [Chondrinema litorale]UZR96823.1 NAD(P)-dependent alcohol dehydrogenase [Chondrinema litorale]
MKLKNLIGLILLFISATSFAQKPINAIGLATKANSNFERIEFTRHAVGDNDIEIEILYAGICHSDFMVKQTPNQVVPGHEIVGRVTKVGKNVSKFKKGDVAGVGCMVNSCGHCKYCKAGKEQFCAEGTVFTYGFPDRFHENHITQGGYSNVITITEKFAIQVPKNADIKKVAPLMCAGVTTWSPIKFSEVEKGDVVGVAGFGGLGHMAVQYLVDLGAKVTVFDITDDKSADAKRLGAEEYVNVKTTKDLSALNDKFDFIISTIPANYEPMMYVKMLKMDGGELAIVGLPANATIPVSPFVMQSAHRRVYGSLIGGIPETQEMLDYSVSHDIYPEIEVIKAEPKVIDEAYENIEEGKVKFRYVIDMQTIK